MIKDPSLNSIDLLWRCISDRGDSQYWSAFVGRIRPKITQFIRGAVRQLAGSATSSGVAETEDLSQIVLTRLIEGDCALLRRFAGITEEDLFCYLAVISRSVVRDAWRRLHSKKRDSDWRSPDWRELKRRLFPAVSEEVRLERRLLAREVAEMVDRVIDPKSPFAERDRLICSLYFVDGLSAAQIACCGGIGLTRPGVEKVLQRVLARVRLRLQFPAAPRFPQPSRS